LTQPNPLLTTIPQFNNIAIINQKVVQIKEVEVDIPLLHDLATGEMDNITFFSSNRQLIHIVIHQWSLRSSMDYGQWEDTLFKVLAGDTQVSDINKAAHQSWNLSLTRIRFSKWKKCDSDTAEKFIYSQKEKAFERINGHKDSELDTYQDIVHHQRYSTFS
tara:strand:+ start:1569 stop:2051 length:483 start_codon:yes stop_codon:yes gene_type:complete